MLIQTFPNVNRYDANRFQNDVQLLLLDWRDGKLSESELETKLKPYRTHDRYNQVIDEFLRKGLSRTNTTFHLMVVRTSTNTIFL